MDFIFCEFKLGKKKEGEERERERRRREGEEGKVGEGREMFVTFFFLISAPFFLSFLKVDDISNHFTCECFSDVPACKFTKEGRVVMAHELESSSGLSSPPSFEK